MFLEICYIDAILKFENSLEKHHKKLKAKLNKFNLPSYDKKYEMDDEEAFDDYQTNLIINNAHLYNTEERKQLNVNLQDIVNIKTEYFTNTNSENGGNSNINQNNNINTNGLNIFKRHQVNTNKRKSQIEEVSSESNSNSDLNEDQEIIDKYNKIIFYNHEHRIDSGGKFLTHNNRNNKMLQSADDLNNHHNVNNINTNHNGNLSDNFSNISPLISHNKKKRNKITKLQQNNNTNVISYISRHDSFTLPRTTSKLKMYKN